MKKSTEIGNKIYVISIWLIPMVFYLVFWALDGAVWCADSSSYVDMYDSREPLYPTILALLRWMLGIGDSADPTSNMSLNVMVLLQSVIAAISVSSLTMFLTGQFLREVKCDGILYGRRIYTEAGHKKELMIRTRQRLLSYLILFIPLGVSFLNRFSAKRASMYSNSILTEGITISIYFLAFRFILDYMMNGSGYSFRMSCLMVLAGISTRKQMYVLLCLFVIAMFYRVFACDEGKKKPVGIIKIVLTTVVIVGMNLLFDCTYNLVVRNSFIIHTEDNRFVTTMALYTAEEGYDGYIEPELREIYLQIYDECDSKGWLMHDAPTGWYTAVDHFADNYDHIQLDTMQVMLEEYVDRASYSGFAPHMTKTEKIDAIRASFNRSLLPHEADRLFKEFMYNVLNGLIDTVARKNFVLSIYSAVIYMLFIVLAISCIIRYGRLRTGKTEYDEIYEKEYLTSLQRRGTIMTVMTLFSIAGNVTLVSAVIFCQARYMIYNMPIFYITMIIMLYILSFKRRRQ